MRVRFHDRDQSLFWELPVASWGPEGLDSAQGLEGVDWFIVGIVIKFKILFLIDFKYPLKM